ncbi:MAG: hypothetical protein ABIE68_01760 [bacterium]
MNKDNKKTEIKKQAERIKVAEKRESYEKINSEQIKKRTKWINENKHLLNEIEGSDLRKAYEVFLINYLGIDPKEVPIVFEDDKKIVWRSYNWCPVLDACKDLNCDTKEVCKKGWEESVDAFVKIINPKLKFIRNYNKIRPHADYCEEMFVLE